jgi:pimeloyl-ACP methyl ester carboxylesterase
MVLWGRSMGACTALMYAHKYPNNVTAMVLDSPFKDLRKLVK